MVEEARTGGTPTADDHTRGVAPATIRAALSVGRRELCLVLAVAPLYLELGTERGRHLGSFAV